MYGQAPKCCLRADWLKADRIFEHTLRTREVFCKKFSHRNAFGLVLGTDPSAPRPPSRDSFCCYTVVTRNARFGAFWCAIQCLERHPSKVQDHACLWYQDASLRTVTKASSLVSTPSVGTIIIKRFYVDLPDML